MVNATEELTQVWPFLAVTSGEPVFWSADELYTYADSAIQALCREAGLLMAPEESAAFLQGQAVLGLPARTLRVILASNSLTNAQMKIRTTSEMNALSDWWRDDSGTPTALVTDAGGMLDARLWPSPDAAGAVELALIMTTEPVSDVLPNVDLPDALRPLVQLAAIAGAREKEGKAALPEVAAVCRQILQAITDTAKVYWSPTQ